MSDKTDFSFSTTLTQPMSRKADDRLIAFDACKAYQLPDQKVLLRNPRNGRSSIVTRDVFGALALCTAFRTMAGHVARLQEKFPAMRGQEAEVTRVLQSTLDDGLMVSAGELCQSIAAPGADAIGKEDPGGGAVVAIITWERPRALARLLASINKNADPASFDTLYVIDDSRGAENIVQNQRAVEAFSAGSKIRTRYFGREQQYDLLSAIAARVPQHEDSLRFLADPERWADQWTSGLARNFALLLSVGKRLVVLDDDAVFEVYEPQDVAAGVTLADPLREAEFFEAADRWPTMHPRRDTDPVRAHLECLGLPFSGALGKLGGAELAPADLGGCTVAGVLRLQSGSPVIATQCGTVGDPGTGGNTWLIELDGRSRTRMLASEQTVGWAIRNHSAWVGRSRTQVAARPNMSLITGLDNRQLLPPYFPVWRNEDRLFGTVLGALFPRAAVLDYAWAAPHLPVEERGRSGRDTDFGVAPKFPAFFADWVRIRADRCQAGTHEARVQALAQLFTELASMSDRELTELHRDALTQAACNDLVDLRAALARAEDAPRNWVEYLQKGLHKVNENVAAGLGEASDGGGEGVQVDAASIPAWRDAWRKFGGALAAWGGIREAAEPERHALNDLGTDLDKPS